MTLYATLDGSLAWAALGFRPTVDAWVRRRAVFIRAYQDLQVTFSSVQQDTLHQLISADDVDIFPVIANLKTEFRDGLQPADSVAKMIFDKVNGWEGEFIVGDKRYTEFLFKP